MSSGLGELPKPVGHFLSLYTTAGFTQPTCTWLQLSKDRGFLYSKVSTGQSEHTVTAHDAFTQIQYETIRSMDVKLGFYTEVK